MNEVKMFTIRQMATQQELLDNLNTYPQRIEELFDEENIDDIAKEVYIYTHKYVKNARKRAYTVINDLEKILREFE